MRASPRSLLLVVAFVVLDLVVIAAAYLLSHRETDPTSEPASTSQAFDEGQGPIQGPLALAASSSGALARVTRGSCDSRDPQRPRVWTSTRAEGRMVPRRVAGLRESLGVTYRGGTVTIVGATASCKVVGFVSTDGGSSWSRRAVPGGVWWLDTDTSSQVVHGPGKDVRLGCVPTSVTTQGAGGRALATCPDLGVQVLSSGTSSPQSSFPIISPGAADGGTERPLVLADQSGCPAALLRATTGQAQASGGDGTEDQTQAARTLECLSSTGAGTGLAVSGQRVFAQVGYRLEVSRDGGASFRAYRNDPVTAEAEQG